MCVYIYINIYISLYIYTVSGSAWRQEDANAILSAAASPWEASALYTYIFIYGETCIDLFVYIHIYGAMTTRTRF